MNTISEFKCGLFELDNFVKKLTINNKNGDIYLLKGDLGSGKTTFARLFIKSLFDKYKLIRPDLIKSPSFPIVINYSLNNFEIYHYDFFRLKDKSEIKEIDFFENLEKNISIVEWPDIILNNFNLQNYYLIEFEIIDFNTRILRLRYSEKNNFYVK